jgi:hypothetical protein
LPPLRRAERIRSIELRQSLDGCTRRVAELAAALASAEQRARTPEPEGEENFANKDRWEKWQECAYLMLGRGKTVRVTTSRDRKIVTVQWWGASPEGRGSATPQETDHD